MSTRFAQLRQGKGPRTGRSALALSGCLIGVVVGYSQLLYPKVSLVIETEFNHPREDVATAPGPVRKRRQQQQAYDPVEINVTTKLSTIKNTSAAIDLFGAMLRAVEMAEQRIMNNRDSEAEERRQWKAKRS